MTTKKNIVALFIGLLAFSSIFAQKSELVKIDALVKATDRAVKKHKSPELVFADVADIESTKEDWRAFASDAALDKHRETSETYSIAYCWRTGGKLAAVNFTLFSPSGDWTNYSYSYYRPDGTLAKAALDYRTFEGELILEQDVYFNNKGKIIKRTQRILELSTHKPKKLTRDIRTQVKSMAEEEDYYKSTSKLPFIKLVK